ncbi:MAG: aminopeptidase P family protein [Deltaproteobacteria bacterium]|nr:aminopeptidase P family protein [Deltaproteobacteria bacterium]
MKDSSLARELRQRVERFQRLLRESDVEGAILVQNMDLYYLIGTDQNGLLWMPAEGEPLFMVRKSYERALQDGLIDHITPLTRLSQVPDQVRNHSGGKAARIGLEMDVLPAKLYLSYKKLFPQAEFLDISGLIRSVRMVKSQREISLIRRAAEIADDLFKKVPEFLKESKTEIELAAKAEAFYRSRGHPGISLMRAFNMRNSYGHILAGAGATMPSASPGPTGGTGAGPFFSHGAGKGKIKPHEPVLFDYTSNVEGYLSDQTRIFCLGDLPEKFYKAHSVMVEVQTALSREGKPGAKAQDLYAMAVDIVNKAGLSKGFMGHPQPVPFVGHGLGLELDEWPLISKNSEHILKKGMTIALEPKIVFPGEGVVGLENTFVVGNNKMEKLCRFPDDIVTIR